MGSFNLTFKNFIILSFILIIISGCENTSDINKTTDDINDVAKKSNNLPNNTHIANQGDNKIVAGMYKVGTDIKSGEYKLYTYDNVLLGSYFELTSDSSGDLDSIISNGTFNTFTYLTVNDGEYLSLQDCYAIQKSSAEPYSPEDGLYLDGMHLVGYDIPLGEYKIALSENSILNMGYVEISSDSRHSFDSIISNNNVNNTIYQTISDGQYLTLQDVYIKLK